MDNSTTVLDGHHTAAKMYLLKYLEQVTLTKGIAERQLGAQTDVTAFHLDELVFSLMELLHPI